MFHLEGGVGTVEQPTWRRGSRPDSGPDSVNLSRHLSDSHMEQ